MFCDLHGNEFFQLGAGFDVLFPLHQVSPWVPQKVEIFEFFRMKTQLSLRAKQSWI